MMVMCLHREHVVSCMDKGASVEGEMLCASKQCCQGGARWRKGYRIGCCRSNRKIVPHTAGRLLLALPRPHPAGALAPDPTWNAHTRQLLRVADPPRFVHGIWTCAAHMYGTVYHARRDSHVFMLQDLRLIVDLELRCTCMMDVRTQRGGEVSCMVYGLYNVWAVWLYRLYGHTVAAGQGRSDVWFVWRPIQHVFLYGGLYET